MTTWFRLCPLDVAVDAVHLVSANRAIQTIIYENSQWWFRQRAVCLFPFADERFDSFTI